MIELLAKTQKAALRKLIEAQLRVWPEHERFLLKRLETGDLAATERLAEAIIRLADDLEIVSADYRWMCERLLEEELHFRRTGGYRLTTFADADREVYSNGPYMRRYVNGLLLSQLWWDNHARVIDHYAREFLPTLREGYVHLEIGPGHGLLLSFAARDPRSARVHGWDFSQASLDATREGLVRLGVTREVTLERRNIVDPPEPDHRFDCIVLSEILEHLEDPRSALSGLRPLLAPGGRMFVNVPVNSPAPDHLHLLRTPEEAVDLVRAAGLTVVTSKFFPLTGYTEARARKAQLTISCAIVASAG